MFGDAIDPNLKTGIATSLMKNGISAVQANAIIKDYQSGEQALLAEQFNPDGYKETMKSTFGDDYEKVIGKTKNALTAFMTKEDNELIDNLPNAYLNIIHRTLGKVVEKYGVQSNDGAHTNAGGGNQQPPDVGAVREALRNQLHALKHKPHSVDEKQALIDKLNATYQTQTK